MALRYPDRLESNNPSAYGIVPASQISGHRTVANLTALYALKDCILSESGNNTANDALGQEWYVVSEQANYRLTDWANRTKAAGWQKVIDGGDIDLSDYVTKDNAVTSVWIDQESDRVLVASSYGDGSDDDGNYINAATTTEAGVMSAEDKDTLDNLHRLATISDKGGILVAGEGGVTADNNGSNVTIDLPYVIDSGDGWDNGDLRITIPAATADDAGVMTAEDKTKLENINAKVGSMEEELAGVQQTVAQNTEDIASLQAEVGAMQTGFCLGRWDEDELDPEIVERKGETAFLEKWDAYLLDTTDNTGETTRPIGKLKRNNWLRFEDGRFAPTVGITEAMRAQCDVELYLNAEHTEKYCDAGAFDAEAFYNEYGMEQKLYDATGEEIGHILRPWETVETKYTIGVGRDDKVYLVDQLKGGSGKVWRGLSSTAHPYDGVDASAYGLEPTAMSPGPVCTVGGKARCFFFLYQGETNCQGSAGKAENCTVFHKQRTYPRVSDMNQVNDMKYARANNSDPERPYPFAEGGYHALNTFITAMEVLYGTKYLHEASLFSSGTSSNDSAGTWENVSSHGGIKIGDGDASYHKWNEQTDIYYDAEGNRTHMSATVNKEAPKWECLEAQMAASFAVETGVAAGVEYKFNGEVYRWEAVAGVKGLADGEMNVKVYKHIWYSFTAYNAEGAETEFPIEIYLRCGLIKGMDVSGDIFCYWGGGAELVGTCEHLQEEQRTGNKVEMYLQPDQRLWAYETTGSKADGGRFGFEDTYMKTGESETLGDSCALKRQPYTPWRTEKGGTIGTGECYYQWDNNYWGNTLGTRYRLALRCRGNAHNTACSGRSLYAFYGVGFAAWSNGGSAQALIGSAAPPQAE